MRIVSWNVNGLRSLGKDDYALWKAFLKSAKPDIFCLQETKASPEQLTEELRETPGFTSFFSTCTVKKGYSGVAIYSKIEPLSVLYGMGIPEFDQEGRFIQAEYQDFFLINAYFPNGGRGPERIDYKMRFYDAFLVHCEKLRKKKPVIFCGDVNTAHEPIDLARPDANAETTGFLPEERAWIDEVIASGYVDVWREENPGKTGAYTYWDQITRARDRNVGWRIDYFFVAREFMAQVKKSDIHPLIFGSDHCPISIDLR